MAKIHTLKISNYKRLKDFEQVFGMTDFVCLLGRGDSGKSTILEAISIVLSPSWNLTFYDSDFYDSDVSNQIEIEASLYNLPKDLIQDTKFGLYIRGLDKATDKIHDTLEEHHEIILTIRFTLGAELEPKWFVVNNRHQDPIEIRTSDRASLNVFLVSDYIDRHFSWSKGNPLYSLLREENAHRNSGTIVLNALREAKAKIDSEPFTHLEKVVSKIKSASSLLGIDIDQTTTAIDFKDISLKDGRVCLHEGSVPFRQKGKGSKRLISIAIQTELANSGGILLIDEIEQGLEPDRAQHLTRTLKKQNNGQIFVSTHSRDVIVELKAANIFRVKKKNTSLFQLDDSLQACLRSNPEAFFSDRVLLCEGPTEIGICRALNESRITSGKDNASYLGIRFANGNGSTQENYALGFLKAGYSVCMFCDSDVTDFNNKKKKLTDLGIHIVDCDNCNSTETQIFYDLPWDGVKELIKYQITQIEESLFDSVKAAYASYGTLSEQVWYETDSIELRKVIGETAKKKNWFKRTDHGEFLGQVCCKYQDLIANKRFGKQLLGLSKWIENV
jgi:putative ATP-dependent endonuclease of OLD family